MRGRRLRRAALTALLVAAAAGPVWGDDDVRALVAPYLADAARGATGEVAGEAFRDSRKPSAPPEPVEGVSVMLLPYSSTLAQDLEAVKRGWRESMWTFVGAAEKVRALRADYERALAMSGGGELVRGEVSGAAGQFRLTGIPAGHWLMLAWCEVPHARNVRKLKSTDAKSFTDNMETAGYVAVTYWYRDLEVAAGGVVSVSLTERNVWLTTVREELRVPTEQAGKSTGSRRR